MAYRMTLCCVLMMGCQVDLPADIRCPGMGPCPEGYSCVAEMCVSNASDASPPGDSSGDTTVDDGAVDGGDDASVDTGPGVDAGPTSPGILVFGGAGNDTVDGVAVAGQAIYIAGTSDSATLRVGNCTAAAGAGIYVARLDVADGVIECVWLERYEGSGARVDAVAATDTAVSVGGNYTGSFLGLTPGADDRRDAFLIQRTAEGGMLTDYHVQTEGNDGITGLAASAEFFCATMETGTTIRGGLLADADVSGTRFLLGALVCLSVRTGNVVGGVQITGDPAREVTAQDVAMVGSGAGQIAWRTDFSGTESAAAVPFTVTGGGVALQTESARGFGLAEDVGVAITPDGMGGVVMSVGYTNNEVRFATPPSVFGSGLGENGFDWEYLGIAGDIDIVDMVALGGRLHVVGRYEGPVAPGERLFEGLPAAPSGSSFHASFRMEGPTTDTFRQDGASNVSLGGVEAMGDMLVLAGTLLTGSATFPTDLTGADAGTREGFVYAFVPES